MALTIDCSTCSLRNTSACDDCVVNFILSCGDDTAVEEADFTDGVVTDGVVIDAAEFFAVRRLQAAGLVPALRHEERSAEGFEQGLG